MGNDLFEKAPIPKAYFSFELPVVFSMVISLVYNMADTYFIAATGNTNLVAGVSLGAPIFTLMIALGDIFGLGGSSVISRLFGKKMDEDGKRLSVFCFYGAIVCGIVVAVLMMLFRAQILTLLGAKADTVQYASDYYTWLVIGAPFIILSFTPSNLLRTEGFSVASMTGTVLGSVINIILDPIFIFVLGMGAAGAAIATVIGNIGADLFFDFFLTDKSKRLSINPKRILSAKENLEISFTRNTRGICYQTYAESWNCADQSFFYWSMEQTKWLDGNCNENQYDCNADFSWLCFWFTAVNRI